MLRIGLSAAANRRGVPSLLLQPDAGCFEPYPAIAAYMQRLGERPARADGAEDAARENLGKIAPLHEL